MFAIKDGYQENPGPVYFTDEPQGDLVYQPDVLPLAEAYAGSMGLTKIVDVGCGWAEKLADVQSRHPEWEFVGIDYGENLEHCRSTYDWGTWLEYDLEHENVFDFTRAVVVISDLIEHLVDPRPLLRSLLQSGGEKFLFSTPERDLQHGPEHMGPSPNPCHVREWNLAEFVTFLDGARSGSFGFTIDLAGFTRTNTGGPEEHTILVVAS